MSDDALVDFYGVSNRSCCYCNYGCDTRFNLILHFVLAHPDKVRSGDIDKYKLPKGVAALAKTTRTMYDEIGEPIFDKVTP